MSYSWFRVDSSVAGHPKELELAARLGDPNAIAYVVRLWCWTQLFAPTGEFTKARADQVEAFCRWSGARGGLIAALLDVGWIEAENRSFFVHDWEELQGSLVAKSHRDAATKAAKRAAEKAKRDEAARAGRARGAPTDETDETRRDEQKISYPPLPKIGSDQQGPDHAAEHWGAAADRVAAELLPWAVVQRDLQTDLPKSTEADAEAFERWLFEWALKHEPDAQAVEQLRRALTKYFTTDTWARGVDGQGRPRNASLRLWCHENVGLYRWQAEVLADREAERAGPKAVRRVG